MRGLPDTPANVMVLIFNFALSAARELFLADQTVEVGENRAPTRVAEGGRSRDRFLWPALVAPINEAWRAALYYDLLPLDLRWAAGTTALLANSPLF
jgi:hypothetical protein